MPEPFERLDEAMGRRRLELRLNWRQMAERAGCSYTALRAIRRGEYRPAELTALGIDDALGWAHGSVYAILDGGEPTLREASTRGSFHSRAEQEPMAGVEDDPVQYAIERLLERYAPSRVAEILDKVISSYPADQRDEIRRRIWDEGPPGVEPDQRRVG